MSKGTCTESLLENQSQFLAKRSICIADMPDGFPAPHHNGGLIGKSLHILFARGQFGIHSGPGRDTA